MRFGLSEEVHVVDLLTSIWVPNMYELLIPSHESSIINKEIRFKDGKKGENPTSIYTYIPLIVIPHYPSDFLGVVLLVR